MCLCIYLFIRMYIRIYVENAVANVVVCMRLYACIILLLSL